MKRAVGLVVVALSVTAGPAIAQREVASTATVTPPAGVVDPNPGNNIATVRLVVVERQAATDCTAAKAAANCAERSVAPAAATAGTGVVLPPEI